MTNGEKLQETFPNMRITVCKSYVQVMGENYEFNNTYPLEWWNAEYQEPSSSEKPNKSGIPTGSDCVDRHSVDLLTYRYLREPTDNHVAFYEDFLDLPSVTPIRPKGHWIDHSDEGYVECPKCGSATNCDDNIADLHFCFSCGADMREVKE